MRLLLAAATAALLSTTAMADDHMTETPETGPELTFERVFASPSLNGPLPAWCEILA